MTTKAGVTRREFMSRAATFSVAVSTTTLLPASRLVAAGEGGKRYVIIHADDAGMSHNVNEATIEGFEKGIVSSCSIMVPCPWFVEFAKYAEEHHEHDYGIHLTLNSEWRHFRWGPVAKRSDVPSLLDKRGYLWPDSPQTAANGNAREVEIELRAQIERALEFGVPLSHLDTHMGTLFTRPDFIEVYVNLGMRYNLPVMMVKNATELIRRRFPKVADRVIGIEKRLAEKQLPMLDSLTTGVGDGPYEERRDGYLKVLKELPEGVSQIIIHCGIEGAELRGITAKWRQRDEDRRVFTDPEVIAAVKEMGVEPISWKKFRELHAKS